MSKASHTEKTNHEDPITIAFAQHLWQHRTSDYNFDFTKCLFR